jgi:hypothetical protein
VPIAVAIILAAAILIGTSIYLSRRRKQLEAELGIQVPTRRNRRALAPTPEPAETRSRIEPATFHVDGNKAVVRFDVPLPPGEVDEILADLLVSEAIEVVREKRHSLPLTHLTEVVAEAGRGEVRRVGSAVLSQPGTLPPRTAGVDLLNLSSVSDDPLRTSFSDAPAEVHAGVEVGDRPDVLTSLARELRIPRAVETGLRANGIDPDTISPGGLVTGLLSLFGYHLNPTGLNSWIASKAGETTYIAEEAYREGDHPELGEATIRKFMIDFGTSGANRGMLVTDKYGPMEIYELERRNPRVRFVTRSRLQPMIDSLALS